MIETERLRLIPITADHVADLRRVYADPSIAHWLSGPWSVEQAEHYAARAAEAWHRDGVHKWMAYDQSTGEVVGRGGLSLLTAHERPASDIAELLRDEAWRARPVEVGWAVVTAHRGRGLGVEIGRAALDFAVNTLGATRVVAFTERHNHPSRRVMTKLGMAYVGEVRWCGLIEGLEGEHDEAPFAVYATEPR